MNGMATMRPFDKSLINAPAVESSNNIDNNIDDNIDTILGTTRFCSLPIIFRTKQSIAKSDGIDGDQVTSTSFHVFHDRFNETSKPTHATDIWHSSSSTLSSSFHSVPMASCSETALKLPWNCSAVVPTFTDSRTFRICCGVQRGRDRTGSLFHWQFQSSS